MNDISRITPLSPALYPSVRRIKEADNNRHEKQQEEQSSQHEAPEESREQDEKPRDVEPRGNAIDILLQ